MKIITLKPGSILLWKEYSKLTKWLHKLFHRKTPYNKVSLFVESTAIYVPITEGKAFIDNEVIVLEPTIDLTEEEIVAMESVVYYNRDTKFDHIKISVNTVRPNTINTSSQIDNLLFNENYKVVYDFSEKN